MKIIGVDVDGVLADFNTDYRRLLCETTGRDLFNGETPEIGKGCWEPPCWYYAEHYGYTKEEDKRVWDIMLRDSHTFWQNLQPYPGSPQFLQSLRLVNADVYFITTRPGLSCKHQTEVWLERHGYPRPTVLIARGDKGGVASTLRLTHFIDDRPENCIDVKEACREAGNEWPSCSISLLNRRYNERYHTWMNNHNIQVIDTLDQFISEVAK